MKKLLVYLLMAGSLSSLANENIYIETDLLNPVLNISGSTNISRYDLRVGYEIKDWDFSLRYLQLDSVSYSGSSSSSGTPDIDISDANDIYVGARVGYKMRSFQFGTGIGFYQREYDIRLNSLISDSYTDKANGIEIFGNYKTNFKTLFIKYELNYIAASLDSNRKKESGLNSYDIGYSDPELSLNILLGYEF
jgi:hypothetical protein